MKICVPLWLIFAPEITWIRFQRWQIVRWKKKLDELNFVLIFRERIFLREKNVPNDVKIEADSDAIYNFRPLHCVSVDFAHISFAYMNGIISIFIFVGISECVCVCIIIPYNIITRSFRWNANWMFFFFTAESEKIIWKNTKKCVHFKKWWAYTKCHRIVPPCLRLKNSRAYTYLCRHTVDGFVVHHN